MYQSIVNNKKFDISLEGEQIRINGDVADIDMASIGNGHFHLLWKNKSYRAELLKTDKENKTVTVKINSRVYSVALKDKYDLLLDKLGMSKTAGNRVNSIKAPMPGLIIDLKIKPGDTVKPGDPLLILEAMKMENILKSPGEGLIKNVKVKKGENVEKGQVLIEF
jgi:biotin carboxyl carrier protein